MCFARKSTKLTQLLGQMLHRSYRGQGSARSQISQRRQSNRKNLEKDSWTNQCKTYEDPATLSAALSLHYSLLVYASWIASEGRPAFSSRGLFEMHCDVKLQMFAIPRTH